MPHKKKLPLAKPAVQEVRPPAIVPKRAPIRPDAAEFDLKAAHQAWKIRNGLDDDSSW